MAAELEGGESEIGRAMSALARVARATVPIQARDEFDVLFLGLVRGELVPYASFYRTGFLYDRPLAAVRADLAMLGVARTAASSEPEDHIATLCEVMAGLIGGEYGNSASTSSNGSSTGIWRHGRRGSSPTWSGHAVPASMVRWARLAACSWISSFGVRDGSMRVRR